jgi:hypothetical protein
MVGSVFSVNAGISCTPQADTFGVFFIAAYYLLIQLLHPVGKSFKAGHACSSFSQTRRVLCLPQQNIVHAVLHFDN